MTPCKTIGCPDTAALNSDFCSHHTQRIEAAEHGCCTHEETKEPSSMAQRYPAYFKDVSHLNEMDVYAVHHVFDLQDPAGILHHASKKILLSGVRTGGKTVFKDIKEARDSLTRWLELNQTEAI